jgi:hypothetical protein
MTWAEGLISINNRVILFLFYSLFFFYSYLFFFLFFLFSFSIHKALLILLSSQQKASQPTPIIEDLLLLP